MTRLAVLLRTTFFLVLLVCASFAHANSQNQKVTIQANAETLASIFKQIKSQTKLVVFYSNELVNDQEKMTINVKEEALSSVMDKIVAGKPLKYEIREKQIVISAKPSEPKVQLKGTSSNLNFTGLHAPPPTVRGRITNEKGEPVSGVSISVKGGKVVGISNDNGEFTLNNIPDNATLVFEALNMEKFERALEGRSELALIAKVKVSELEEVVINKGYYTEKKKLSVGNVSRITAKEIQGQPVDNVLKLLGGLVPGLYIKQLSGQSGSAVDVTIQGENSIASGNAPFYVVDGVPYFSQLLNTTSLASSQLGAGNPLNFINPSDIESIEVLKDADATAIFGSRAANGAILITTKKGKAGAAKINLNVQHGWGTVSRFLKLLNTQQYLSMRREAKSNDNAAVSATDFDINGLWDTTRYTDWQKELIGKSSQFSNINLGMSGGSESVQYNIGGTFQRQSTVTPGNFADQKGSLHFSINSSSDNKKLKVQLIGNYQYDKNTMPSTEFTRVALQLAPNAPALYNSDGSLNWAPNVSGTSSWENPIKSLLDSYEGNSKNLLLNSTISYKLINNLEVKLNAGYTNLQLDEFRASPAISRAPETRATFSRLAQFSNSSLSSWLIEPQINYRKNINLLKLDFLAGATFQSNKSDGLNFYGQNFSNDAVLRDIRSAGTITISGSINSAYKYSALFGRLNLNLKDRYLINLTARRDGSSRFGPENLFNNFWGIGAGWIFSEEGNFKKALPWLDFGKLRASYGTTGNDQIGDYKYLSLSNIVSVGVPYQGVPVYAPTGHANPYLQWEETTKLNIGLDLNFFKERLRFSGNYVLNQSSNQLLYYILPNSTGFSGVTKNFPATVQNREWQFSIGSTNVQSKKLTWSTTFNLTLPQNKLVAFPGLQTSSYSSSLIIGQPINLQKSYKFLGVDPTSGLYTFADQNGTPTSSPTNADRTQLISLFPQFYGGIQNNIQLKNFSLEFSIQFSKRLQRDEALGFSAPGRAFNQPAGILEHWVQPGQIASFQKFSTGTPVLLSYNNTLFSDVAYGDASFIRLRNVTFSYTLPMKSLSYAKLHDARIFINGQNLLTLTKFKGLDPETGNYNLPPLRIITLGLNVTF